MPVLLIDEVAAKARLAVSTVREMVKEGTFPQPFRLTERKRGWLEGEIDDWIAKQAAARSAPSPEFMTAGRRRYWDEVRSGLRPHPRTVWRLRREAAEAVIQAADGSPENQTSTIPARESLERDGADVVLTQPVTRV